LVTLVFLAALPLLSSGCTVPAVGVAGIGVDAERTPSATYRSAAATLTAQPFHADGKDDDQRG
jgi:hypothetical protein